MSESSPNPKPPALRSLAVEDVNGYTCRLERWKAKHSEEWLVSATVHDPWGRQILHEDEAGVSMDPPGALAEIMAARLLHNE